MDHIFLAHHNEFQTRMAFVFSEVQERLVAEYDHVNAHLKANLLLFKQQHRRTSHTSSVGGHAGHAVEVSGHTLDVKDLSSRRTSIQSSSFGGSQLMELPQAVPSRTASVRSSAMSSGRISGRDKMWQATGSTNSLMSLNYPSTNSMYPVCSSSSMIPAPVPAPSPIQPVPEHPDTPTSSQEFSAVVPLVRQGTRFSDQSCDNNDIKGTFTTRTKESEAKTEECESEDDYEFFVLDAWEKANWIRKSSKFRQDSFHISYGGSEFNSATHQWLSGFAVLYGGKFGCMHPSSVLRLVWDLISMTFILADVVFVPLDLLDSEDSSFQIVTEWLARLFWTFDIPLFFFTGYYDTYGTLQMAPRHVAMEYVKTWLGLDLALVMLGWIEGAVSSSGDSDTFRILRWLRGARAFRLVRFWRLLRLAGTFDFIRWRVQSELVMLLFNIVKHVMGILVLAHFVACFWYGISKGSDGGVQRWMNRYYAENDMSPSISTRYAYSFLWALAQFTTVGLLENTEVRSAAEVFYGVAIMVFTFVVSACFVSMITTSMTSFQLVNENSLVQSNALRKFLIDHRVSPSLAARIQRSALQAAKEQKQHTPEKNIELLKVLSKPLRMELRYELYQPLLVTHAFFKQFEAKRTASFSSMCHSAIEEIFISQKDVCFTAGEIPKHPGMFFIGHGEARYFWGEAGVENIERETSLCEAFLWTEWIYHGTLCATSACRLLMVQALNFQKVTRESLQGIDFQPLQTYARDFVRSLNKVETVDLNDLVPERTIRSCTARAFTCDEKLKPSKSCGSIGSGSTGGSVHWSLTQSVTSSGQQKRVFFEEICNTCR